MAHLSSRQANDLADMFLKLARLTGDYQYKNAGQFSEEENQQLTELHTAQLNLAGQLYTRSAALVLSDADRSLQTLKNLTARLRKTYATIGDVKDVLKIAASIVALGTSVLALKPLKTAEAINDLAAKLKL